MYSCFTDCIEITVRDAIEERIEQLRTLWQIPAVEIRFPLPPVGIMEVIILDIIVADIESDIELLGLHRYRDMPVKLDIDMVLAVGRVLTGYEDPVIRTTGIVVANDPMGLVVRLESEWLAVIGVVHYARSGIYQQIGYTTSSGYAAVVVFLARSTKRGDTVHGSRTATLTGLFAEP